MTQEKILLYMIINWAIIGSVSIHPCCKVLHNTQYVISSAIQRWQAIEKPLNKLTAATVSMSNTFVQYRQAFAFPYLVWHSSKNKQNTYDRWVKQKIRAQTHSETEACGPTIKPIHLSNLSAFMISTEQRDAIRPFCF